MKEKDIETEVIAGKVENKENIRAFLDGSTRSDTKLRSAIVGFGVYNSGWKWSQHAGAQTGKPSANHIGYILSGRIMIQDAIGKQREVGPGEAFEVGPGHDAWVIGSKVCKALDFTHLSESEK